MENIDNEALAIYRAGGFAMVCCLCLSAPLTVAAEVRLSPPAIYPKDAASFIASMCAGDRATVCDTCTRLFAERDVPLSPVAPGFFALLREVWHEAIQSSAWFNDMAGGDRVAMLALLQLVGDSLYRDAVAAIGGAEPPLPPTWRFMFEFMRSTPICEPLRGDTLPVGPLRIFSRDLGLGCYVSMSPLMDDNSVVWVSDFFSKHKKRGYGGICFRRILKEADRFGVTLAGAIEAHGGPKGSRLSRRGALSNSQLLSWYTRLGFLRFGTEEGLVCVRRPPRS